MAIATTMGLVTTSLLHIVAALEWRDPTRSVFNRDTIANGRFNLLMLIALVLDVPGHDHRTAFNASSTPSISNGDQWRACLIAVAGYFVLAELGKVLFRHFHEGPRPDATSAILTRAPSSVGGVIDELRVAPGSAGQPRRPRHRAGPAAGDFAQLSREKLDATAKAVLADGIEQLSDAQELLWASDTYALLIVFQAMDAAGKDSTIKHVMSGVNPQGVQVVSFKQPSSEELDHTFLWRISNAAPERGRIGIFNRSHYEEVVALRVHPEWLDKQNLPARRPRAGLLGRPLRRPQRVRAASRSQRHEDRQVLPPRVEGRAEAALHGSPRQPQQAVEVQRRRRRERAHWDDYMQAYEDAITATSTAWAPWYVIPADHKHVMQAMAAAILVDTITSLDLHWPVVSDKDREANAKARRTLEAETD